MRLKTNAKEEILSEQIAIFNRIEKCTNSNAQQSNYLLFPSKGFDSLDGSSTIPACSLYLYFPYCKIATAIIECIIHVILLSISENEIYYDKHN